ncbi:MULTISPECIES: hypothetical protein [Pseudomonadaceae]|uniref:hypothetical protein n=1 Tax=Pseudomonadaceae TaxID=135621 RepID=UPI001F0F5A9C|nr:MULTISPECIES: hypothetical protein [Pseudomonas]
MVRINGVGRVSQVSGLTSCAVLSVMLAVPGSASAGKLGQVLGSAAGSAGGTLAGEVSAEAVRQALATKGMTEEDFFREVFARGVPRAKQDLPKMVDTETQFYDVTGSGREWGYWYRLNKYTSQDMDPAAAKRALAPGIIAKVCSTPSMVRPFMEMGGTYRYNYVGRDGQLITSIQVSRQDCS